MYVSLCGCGSVGGRGVGKEEAGGDETYGGDLGIRREIGAYSAALHQCQRGLRFDGQLYYHYQLIN